MTLDDFERLARSRRATRRFKPDPVDDALLERLLTIAQWAPSGYNLQPTHFVVVTDKALKTALHPACMKQNQITEAPAVVVFCGDRRVKANHLEAVLASDRAAGGVSAEYEKILRKFTGLAFDQGPLGIGWLWKAALPPFGRFVAPIPSIPAVEKKYWVGKQVMLAAMTFMLAASAAGLATVPMEGFDERRVRKVLGIPRSQHVALIVPVGYAAEGTLSKTRLPLKEIVHRNGW